MTPAVILGVDPGKTGAIAAVDATTGVLVWVEDMPHDVNGALIRELLLNEHAIGAWVEQVHAMPRQGVSSTFAFGVAYGKVLGALTALLVPVHHVTPATWKKAMRVTADKGTSRTRAVDLFPTHAGTFARVKDDGRAEAALIARYGWEQRGVWL